MTEASPILIGVDVGGTKTAVVAGIAHREELTIVDRRVFPTEPRSRSWRFTLDRICREARELARERAAVAVGVSCGGPLDSRAGVLHSPPNLPGWDDVPIVDELRRSLGCSAFLQNDANACALAEWRFGAGVGARNMVFLTFGTGMGAGLILDGKLYDGTNDFAGEVGHVRLADEGPRGYGKSGSFEGFCSGGGIALLARAEAEKAISAGRTVSFCPDTAALESITSRAVGEAAEAGDPVARDVLEVSGRLLGRGLAMLIDILNPERIVIGSIFVRCRRFLQPAMETEIGREALAGAARACQIVPALLGDSIGDYACLSVAVDGLARRAAGNREEK